MGGPAPAPELAQAVRLHVRACEAQYGLSAAERRVLGAIAACRTAALGGQRFACDTCGAEHFVYHSCRNRHCPKCQTLAKERWLAARTAELLPVPYFHLVFTLPHALHVLALSHARVIYDLLFTAAAQTLADFGRNPRWLGGQIGVTLVLHTWAQDLSRHIHVHGVVTGGALSDDGLWIHGRRGFLFPVQALSKVFRGKYLDALTQQRDDGALAGCAWTADAAAWADFLRRLRRHDWVVYAKRPFAGPQQVLEYLGRYTHRVAITHARIVSIDNEIAFRCRDRTVHGRYRRKIVRLPGADFLHRFLLHVLPQGFKRIRHYGLTASRCKKERLAACRAQLKVPPPEPTPVETPETFMQRVAGIDVHCCPACKNGRLTLVAQLPAWPHPFAWVLTPHITGPPACAIDP